MARISVLILWTLAILSGATTAVPATEPSHVAARVSVSITGLKPGDRAALNYLRVLIRPVLTQETDDQEAAALKRWPQFASRKGARLTLVLAGGARATLTSNGECDGMDACADFSFAGYLSRADRLLVRADYGEGVETLLIDRRTHVFVALPREVHGSPDGRLVVSMDDYSEGQTGRFVHLDALSPSGGVTPLWRSAEPPEGQGGDDFAFVRWVGVDRIAMTRRKAQDNGDFAPAKPVILVRRGGEWRLEPGR